MGSRVPGFTGSPVRRFVGSRVRGVAGSRVRVFVLAVAIAFFARDGLRRGFRDYEISVLAGAWFMPLFSRSIADFADIPLGLIVMLTLYVITLRRALFDREEVATSLHRIAQA